MKLHFVGIAGSGMSALAQLAGWQGHEVSGSDRSFDRGEQQDTLAALRSLGILVFPQDGSGVNAQTQEVVYSTAVEKDNPDFARAAAWNIPLVRRAALLARFFDQKFGIAIAGTSGKSTVAAMLATILDALGMDPTYYGGAAILGHRQTAGLANARAGRGRYFCAETDESDGSFLEFHPEIALVTNISRDHKPLETLTPLFLQFMQQAKSELVLNADCPVLANLRLPQKQLAWYGTDTARFPLRIQNMSAEATAFEYDGEPCHLRVPGMHNVSNALAALAAAARLEIPMRDAAQALEAFRGIARRMECIGKARGVSVFDDYAHNPAKIEAALKTLQDFFPRVAAVFQLHGFGPARFMREELTELFTRLLRPGDILILPDIYDAGGTADRSLSAKDIAMDIQRCTPSARVLYMPERQAILDFLIGHARAGDAIAVMGARDATLPDFAREIAGSLSLAL